MLGDHIELTFPGGKRVDARLGDFVIRSDQAVSLGGEASAPAPFDLFLASIATCAGIFALGFCQARKLETQGLGLRMEWTWDEKKKLIAGIRINLTLPDGFPDHYRDGILRAVDLCAVKRHLHEAPDFSVHLT